MVEQTKPIFFFCDNQDVLELAKNLVYHECTKYIVVHCYFIRQLVEEDKIELQYCTTEEQTEDIFLKSLNPNKFVKFRD